MPENFPEKLLDLGVVCRAYPLDPNWRNERPQRTLISWINGDTDLDAYAGLQVKVLQLHQNDWLGKQGHKHDYSELYFILEMEGQSKDEVIAVFDLMDPESGISQRFELKPGMLLLIPKGIAHRAYGKAGLQMLAITGAYREGYDIPCEFEPLGEAPFGLAA